ncbi:hypothetical protein IFM89_010511 [Coptis chinensis]|uniref:SPX domain-containing protein n=1 Tax=Coptis chinensis TaxID=261450 RepID=A0A835HU72_9MAGN|nr:hypothetical protein IFM89_010511 [Coptis chinensis]
MRRWIHLKVSTLKGNKIGDVKIIILGWVLSSLEGIIVNWIAKMMELLAVWAVVARLLLQETALYLRLALEEGERIKWNLHLRRPKKMIKATFVELYRGFGLLKTYSSLNMVTFTKILKKFDKPAKQQASGSYLKVVKRFHFISSDKVVKLGDEVESIFTKHFANNDRKKAMKYLRPQPHKASHMITFLVDLFTACLLCLACTCSYMDATSSRGRAPGSTTISYLNSLYRDVFLICTSFTTAAVGAMVIHLILRSSHIVPHHVDASPGILLVVSIGLLICPFNIFYRSTHYCFLQVIRNIAVLAFYHS